MTDLITRLRAKLDEVESYARPHTPGDPNAELVLDLAAAHRKILDEHESICAQYNDPARSEPMAFGPAYGLWIALVAIAQGYGIVA